jgi:hypothetical protein
VECQPNPDRRGETFEGLAYGDHCLDATPALSGAG